MSQRFLKLGWRSVAFKCTYPIPNIKHLRKPWFDMGFTDIQTLFLVARIYTTTQPCVFDINVSKRLTFCHFSNQKFRNETTKSLQRLFFHLASARYVSLGHVVAIDPLIDSIPESSIDCWASAVLHLTGRCCQQGSICWGPATFVLPRTRTFRVHSLRMWTTDFTTKRCLRFSLATIFQL